MKVNKAQCEALRQFVDKITIRNKTDVLPEPDVERIFDRFYTGDKARNKKGTGLGLFIAKSLMIKMDGELFATLKNHQFIMTCQWNKRT